MELKKLADDLQLVGEWINKMGLPCPDAVWVELNAATGFALTDGLLFRIKETIKNYDEASIALLLEKPDKEEHHLCDLYFLFVFYEYPVLKKCVLRLSAPPNLKFFNALCEALRERGAYA